MIWRELKKSGEIFDYTPEIWRVEQSMPRWFKASSACWTRTFEEYERFVKNCSRVFALFNSDGEIVTCIYVENAPSKDSSITIHLSCIRRLDEHLFIAQMQRLRDLFFREGITLIRGWMLEKNFVLSRMVGKIGFCLTELSLDYGQSHGKTFRWTQIEIRRAA